MKVKIKTISEERLSKVYFRDMLTDEGTLN